MASPLALWDPLSPVCSVLGRLITWGSKRLGTTSPKSPLMILAFYNTLKEGTPPSHHSAQSQDIWAVGVSSSTLPQNSAVLGG